MGNPLSMTSLRVGRAAVLVVPLAAAAALAACGGGSETKKASARLVPAGTKLSRLDITVSEPRPGIFHYTAPKSVRGGLVEMRLKNVSKTAYKAQLLRLRKGHTMDEALPSGIPNRRLFVSTGGVPLTKSKATGAAVQNLPAGTYLVTGSDELRGIDAWVRVTGGGAAAKLPPASSTVTAVDFSYRFKNVQAGHTAIEFVNAGKEPHHAYFAPMREGRTLSEVKKYSRGQLSGPPPVDQEEIRETPVLAGGQRQVSRLDLQAGRYAVLCFLGDHLDRGMLVELKVP
jgi:hypothetical protein